MKIQQWLLFTVAALILFAGCAERQNPVYSTEEYAFQVLSQTQTTGWAVDISIASDSAYVAEHEGGVTVWDISDPLNLIIKDTLRTAGSAKMIEFAHEANLFLVNEANSQGGVAVYSYVDHHNIHENKCPFIRTGSGIMRDYAFYPINPDTIILAGIDDTDGMFVQAIYWSSDINEWEKDMGNLNDNLSLPFGTMRGLYFDHDYLYVANNEIGFAVIRVEYNPILMTVLGTIDTPGAARSVGLNDAKTHAIVADFQSGLVIVDITDAQNPEIVSTICPDGVDQAIKVVVRHDMAYFIDNNNGIFAVDVSNPLNPELKGRYDTPAPTAIAVTDDDIVFLTDEDLGIIVLDWR